MAYKSKGPSMRQGGTFMSKHNSSYMHKQNLLNDMPVDDHAGSPMHQKEEKKDYDLSYKYQGDDQKNVMEKRSKNFMHHYDKANKFQDKIIELNKTDHSLSDDQVNQINQRKDNLNKNVDIRYQRFNKSKDSIKKVNTSKANALFDSIMNMNDKK